MSEYDPLEWKRYLYLGGRVSAKHKLFQLFAKLGYDEARKMAILKFVRWKRKNPKAKRIKVFEKLLELKGMANLLPTLKELTRTSMILGNTTKIEDY